MQNAFANMSVPHFLRFILLNLAVTCALYAFVVPFFIWHGNIFVKTGYRKVDLLLAFVPIAGNIAFTRSQWRYCAKTRYWDTAPVVPVPVAA